MNELKADKILRPGEGKLLAQGYTPDNWDSLTKVKKKWKALRIVVCLQNLIIENTTMVLEVSWVLEIKFLY